MKVQNLLWWFFYTIFAILLQGLVAGVDLLLPAYLIAIQEGSKKQLIWVGLIFILIQEGIGTSFFGASFLSYALIFLCVEAAQRFFQPDNLSFVFFLSALVGVNHFIIVIFLTDLQNIPYQLLPLLKESLYQFLLTPIIWQVAAFSRRRIRNELFT